MIDKEMKLIRVDQDLTEFFVGRNSFLDGSVEEFKIFCEDDFVNIFIKINMRGSSDYERVYLKCIGCKYYSLFFSDDYHFYEIHSLKFFKNKEGLYYISFDPFDENEEISSEDQDCILCASLEARIESKRRSNK